MLQFKGNIKLFTFILFSFFSLKKKQLNNKNLNEIECFWRKPDFYSKKIFVVALSAHFQSTSHITYFYI